MTNVIMITIMIMILILTSSAYSLSIRFIKNSIIVPSIILFNINDNVKAADLNNGMVLFKASCSSCHYQGGNTMPFSQGKTLSMTDLQTNGYDTVDKMIPLIKKGKGLMPGFGSFIGSKGQVVPARFTEEQMTDIASYVLDQSISF